MLKPNDYPLERGTYLGGYDASAIVGANPYLTPLSCYARMIGLTKQETEMNLAMELGLYLEPFVLDKAEAMLSEIYGERVYIQERQAICVHDKYPFIAGHIDGLATVGDHIILIDAKTTSAYSKKSWDADEGELPAAALYQIYHYFACIPEATVAYVAVLIGNEKIELIKVERDEEIISGLIGIEVDFWENHVVTQIPPNVDMISGRDLNTLKNLYPVSEERAVEITDDTVIATAKQLVEVKARIKELEDSADQYQAILEYELASADTGKAGNVSFSWKSQSRTAVSTKALKEKYPEIYDELSETTSSRVFRIKELKEKKS